jgi:hypothetical protein
MFGYSANVVTMIVGDEISGEIATAERLTLPLKVTATTAISSSNPI